MFTHQKNKLHRKIYIFWDTTLCSPLKVNRRFGELVASIFRIEVEAKQETSIKYVTSKPVFMLVSCLFYSSVLNMEATCSPRNVGLLSIDYTALRPGRQNSS
jgi:hypothetical protein